MRYLPLTDSDRQEMLNAVGVSSVESFFADVPKDCLLTEPVAELPPHQSELSVERWFADQSARNKNASQTAFFCGAGAYRHHVPASVDHIIQRSEYLTSYTPYQPEISQGTLQTLFEFQTQVAQITGMDVANASMYDGATSTAEAVLMACRLTGRSKAVLSGNLHPHYIEACKCLGEAQGISFEILPTQIVNPHDDDKEMKALIDGDTACIVVQNPDFFGHLRDCTPLSEAAHHSGALLIAAITEIVSLGLIKSPGEMDADIVAAEGQSLGVGLQFGGPHVGLFACRNDRQYLRQIPGRLCGETVDQDGKRGFVLTLSTREQHIRRAKATSNICTNAGLMSLAFTIHLTLLGEKGFKQMARSSHARAVQMVEALLGIDHLKVINRSFFNEFVVELPCDTQNIVDELAQRDILAGVPVSRLIPGQNLDRYLLLACTERTTNEEINLLTSALKEMT